MNALDGAVGGLAALAVGIPVAALAYAVPAEGPVRVPARWWWGEPAPPKAVFGITALVTCTATVVCARVSSGYVTGAYWLFAVIGVALAIVDLRRHRLPHVMTGALWTCQTVVLITESAFSRQAGPLILAVSAGAGVVTVSLGIALVLPGQLGLGDVSMAGVVALSLGRLGIDAVVLGLLAGVSLQAIIALVHVARSGVRHDQLPFGPALFAGWLVAILLKGG